MTPIVKQPRISLFISYFKSIEPKSVYLNSSLNSLLVEKNNLFYAQSLGVTRFRLDCKTKQNTSGHKATTRAAAAGSNLPTEALCSDFMRTAPFHFASRQRKDYGTLWKDDEKKICPTLQTSP